jgi:hypothetical protein
MRVQNSQAQCNPNSPTSSHAFFASHQVVRRKEKQAISYSDFMSCAHGCACALA